MSLPVVGQEDAPQIGMIIEDDSEQIVSLSLVPIRSAPDTGYSGHMGVVFAKDDLQTNPMMPGGREQMIVNFETRLFFRPAIKATQISQEVELQTRRGL